MPHEGRSTLELWGGHECTVHRIEDRFFDQTVKSGHQHRLEDLELFASLGLTTLRYPVLWERVSPDHPEQRDFSWSDQRLAELRRLGVRPIVGLIHHGSGPWWTNLLDDDGFAKGLAAHARATAERYPWVEDWTPVNEPLTTARFSGLYGIWYPHARSYGECWRALLNQIDAVRLSMREIRQVNPKARLIQTEDLGFVHSTPAMAEQAAFENHRRWLTWDLLCGRVTPDHPLWEAFEREGLAERLRAIADDPCPPDVLGVNYYLSSERWLDDRNELFDPGLLATDGPGEFVNIEAVRAAPDGILGPEDILAQALDRYGLPVAVTEAHNGCTREEQMRWFVEVWRAAERLNRRGRPLLAVTAWSLLGCYDWNSLLSRNVDHYEPGVFDLTGGRGPRPTGMVELLRELAAGREPTHPALAAVGWWARSDRLSPAIQAAGAVATGRPDPAACAPLLIVGRPSVLTDAFVAACRLRNLPHLLMEEPPGGQRPLALVGLALNERHTRELSELGLAYGCPVMTFNCPIGGSVDLAVHAGDLLSPVDIDEFTGHVLETLSEGRVFRAASNRYAPGVYVNEAVHTALDLFIDGADGVFDIRPVHQLSWAELAAVIANEAGLDASLVEPVEVGRIGRRPAPAPQGQGRAHPVRPLRAAASAYIRRRQAAMSRSTCAPKKVQAAE